jgi:UDP-N-acetylmuramoyl-tripeptide--D-alanyl-D-alanine ligase
VGFLFLQHKMQTLDTAALYKIFLQFPSVQTDTRKIRSGDIFFALKGPSFNGNAFAEQALELGAAYVVVDELAFAANPKCILVEDVLKCLQLLARHHRQQFNIPFIAITGSNGKTTSKELVATVLSQKFKTYATEGNLNNHIGVPLTILKIKNDAEMAIIEMGANHQREIASYCEIALPNFGIINNCGKAHIEGFGGIEGVRKGKGELYDFIRNNGGTIFRNVDLDYLVDMAKGISNQITYGSDEAVYVGYVTDNSITLDIHLDAPDYSMDIHSNLVGEYNFPNLMLAVAVGDYFGVAGDEIKSAIEAYQPDNSRSQLIEKSSNKIILDAYNANPTSMRAAISNFSKLEGSKILWLGAMKEMGTDEAKEHQELLAFIEQWQWEDIILVGKEFEPFKADKKWFETSMQAAEYISQNKPREAMILIKGSRGSKMEKMFDVL